MLLSPFIPLLFMGEEYGEEAPFPFFVSFSDPALSDAVRDGRIRDFAAFEWAGQPPDPAAESTFERAKLDHALEDSGRGRLLSNLYRELLRLRREVGALARRSRTDLEVMADDTQGVLMVRRWDGHGEALAVFNTGEAGGSVAVAPGTRWQKAIDSSEELWGGSGAGVPGLFDGCIERTLELKPRSFVLFIGESNPEVAR